MNILRSTQLYEAWLASRVHTIKSDLRAKHELIAKDAFSFLRGTFYRWMQLFPVLCPKTFKAPKVLAVGDLHVANYGTWRDAEGRLIWGINDFDEAFPLPYTVDLVRLATSALLGLEIGHLTCGVTEACDAIRAGYQEGLAVQGDPFVLSERHSLLRDAVTSRARDPVLFWAKLNALPTATRVPAAVTSMLRKAMPAAIVPFRVAHRRAGLGSLGRERFTAIADWCGGKIARETKALLPSACAWATGSRDTEIHYSRIVGGAIRAADPFLKISGDWVVRRLSPYCSRIELSQLPRTRDEEKLLHAMGLELANIHLGTRGAARVVQKDLSQRRPKWLRDATELMAEAVRKDWKEWRKGR